MSKTAEPAEARALNTAIIGEAFTSKEYGFEDPVTKQRPVTKTDPGIVHRIARLSMTDDLAAYEVDPGEGWVIWAGDEMDVKTGRWRDTAFLRFESEAEAEERLAVVGRA